MLLVYFYIIFVKCIVYALPFFPIIFNCTIFYNLNIKNNMRAQMIHIKIELFSRSVVQPPHSIPISAEAAPPSFQERNGIPCHRPAAAPPCHPQGGSCRP